MGKKWLNERSKEDCMMSEKEETEKKAVCESKEMREALIIIALYVFCRMEDPVCISFSLSLDVRPSFSWCNFAGESFTGLFMRPKRWWSLYLLSLSLHVFFSAVAPHFSFSTSFTFSFSPQVLIMTKMKKNKRRQRTRRRDDWLSRFFVSSSVKKSFTSYPHRSYFIVIPSLLSRCSCLFSFIASSTSSSPDSLSLLLLVRLPKFFSL